MRKEKLAQRKKQIRLAAYTLLAEKGYKNTSMLAIAKKAKASNETLYKWYGSKQKLFKTLIEENSLEIRRRLEEAIDGQWSVSKTLDEAGALLLSLVVSEKAIVLNRAAAADAQETAILGLTLAEAGRNAVVPLMNQMFEQAKRDGELIFSDKDRVTETYIHLLIGDLQIRRVIGALGPLSQGEIDTRVTYANILFLKLFAQPRKDTCSQ